MRPNYINRHIDRELEAWASSDVRKCLLLRGARQVGKSSSVRKLGEKFEFFLEITFEKDDDARNLFEKAGNLQPQELCNKLSLMKDTLIVPGKTLLFLDEIQSSLCVISSLRFFYEDYPELHVVAAGSLLEFAMEELPSFGVRRIRSLFMYPFSFSEFLSANGNNLLLDAIKNASPHCSLDDLMISLRSDFAKYKRRILMLQISTVFRLRSEKSRQKVCVLMIRTGLFALSNQTDLGNIDHGRSGNSDDTFHKHCIIGSVNKKNSYADVDYVFQRGEKKSGCIPCME